MAQKQLASKRPSPMYSDTEEKTKEEISIGRIAKFRQSWVVTILLSIVIPAIILITLEWIARGTLGDNRQGNGFFQSVYKHFSSFFIAYLLLVFIYVFISQLTKRHSIATAVTGLLGYLPAVVTHYKLTMRGEPFLPWDLSQISDLMGIQSNVSYTVKSSIVITAIIYVLMIVGTVFIKYPVVLPKKMEITIRLCCSGASLAGIAFLFFGIFLSPSGTKAMGIREDAWMQDRYYRTNGVITGFLTNFQLLNIAEPEDYSAERVAQISEEVALNAQDSQPYYSNSPALAGDMPRQPDIIYVMAESFWDVTRLDGIAYDREILPNLTRLENESAFGTAYTPSFGGGTCDVEFEALTGFSIEFLPSGSKPYQQYITQDTFALPQYLKSSGYATMAIHGYGRRFWNRDVAYPRIGIDTFIAEEDFVDPDRRRNFISDDAMVDMIIQQYEGQENADQPLFIHAVTMQNHTTYDRSKYPEDELVRVTEAPSSLPDATIGQLEDCATGIFEMDAAIGKLTDYLAKSDRPTILVFWGDHMNPMSDGYKLFEETGLIEAGDTGSPELHQTPLMIWSNYSDEAVDLGTLGTYNISPVMMDLYGIEKPVMFEYLVQQLGTLRARSHGITVNPDGTTSLELTQQQQASFDAHGVLQYDYLFGQQTLEAYIPPEEE